MKESKVFVAGHRGMVGSAVLDNLKSKGYKNIVTKTRNEVDLTSQQDVNKFFKSEKIDYVIYFLFILSFLFLYIRNQSEFAQW